MLSIDPLRKPPDIDIKLGGSKSITNRSLIVAALAKGTSTLHGALFAEDTYAMIDCLRRLGIQIECDEVAKSIVVVGSSGHLRSTGETLWVRQSGTTARFIMPLAALSGGEIRIDGDPQILNLSLIHI